ncbi:hypothetical protein BX600DRAFT_145487 [Xylariales sp. PMI_506]|nr:hypothetical protein BX600DRAFT_145487 [Xylariales sp. PMI_506]
MQFSTVTLAALVGLASAQTVHVVSVSTSNNSLIFTPDNIAVPAGDFVQFQFRAGNHSVVQSNFDNPCTPIANNVANTTGVFSGYQPVAAGASTNSIPAWTIAIANTNPIWLYCSQAKHCQAGMSMVINENTTANATRSLANYKVGAAAAAANVAPGSAASTSGSTSSTSGSSSSTTSSSSSSSSTTTATTGGASGLVISTSLMGLVGFAAALLSL